MQARKAASVLPEPVGAEINVVRPARMCGQPCSCGSVGVPNLEANHSATSGCAHERNCIFVIVGRLTWFRKLFACLGGRPSWLLAVRFLLLIEKRMLPWLLDPGE